MCAAAAMPRSESADLNEFVSAASRALAEEGGEVLFRAVSLVVQSDRAPLEVVFVGLFAALESALTCFRGGGDYDILPHAEFERLEKNFRA